MARPPERWDGREPNDRSLHQFGADARRPDLAPDWDSDDTEQHPMILAEPVSGSRDVPGTRPAELPPGAPDGSRARAGAPPASGGGRRTSASESRIWLPPGQRQPEASWPPESARPTRQARLPELPRPAAVPRPAGAHRDRAAPAPTGGLARDADSWHVGDALSGRDGLRLPPERDADRLAAERLAAERRDLARRLPVEPRDHRHAAERQAAERQAAERQVAERQAAEDAERQAAERQVAEREDFGRRLAAEREEAERKDLARRQAAAEGEAKAAAAGHDGPADGVNGDAGPADRHLPARQVIAPQSTEGRSERPYTGHPVAVDGLPAAQTMAPRQAAQPAVVAAAAPETNSDLEEAQSRAARLAESTRSLAARLRHAERKAADAKAAERSEVALREAAQQVAETQAAELRDVNRRLAAAEREARRDERRDGGPENLAAGSLADLRGRLDRLPAGHPSSPRHDDGTAKEPPPQLIQLELTPPGPNRPAVGGRSDETGDLRRASEPMRAIALPADGANGDGGRSGADVASLLEQTAAC